MNNLLEWMKRNQTTLVAVAGVAVVGLVSWAYLRSGGSGPTELGEGYYFSTDNGATYFKGTADDVSPFDHGGQPACRVHFGLLDGQTKVYYLDRFTPKARDVVVRMRNKQPVGPNDMVLLTTGREYKQINESQWHTFDEDAAKANWVNSIKGPNGKTPFGLQ